MQLVHDRPRGNEGGLVSPVQVLDDQHDRPARSDHLEELHDLVDHTEPHVRGRRHCTRVQAPAFTPEDPADGRPARVRRPRPKIHGFRDHAEGTGSLQRAPATPENTCTKRDGVLSDLLNKPGLTNPSLALDQQHRRLAANHTLDELSRKLQLVFAPYNSIGRRLATARLYDGATEHASEARDTGTTIGPADPNVAVMCDQIWFSRTMGTTAPEST